MTDDKDVRRSTDKIVGDLLDAAEAAGGIVGCSLPTSTTASTMRSLVDLADDVPKLAEDLHRWRALQQ